MRSDETLVAALSLSLCGCRDRAEQQPQQEPAKMAPGQAIGSRAAGNTGQEGGPASLTEPHGPIELNSAEAAGQVVQSYGALIERKRWAEANALWGDSVNAAKFQNQLAQSADVHLEIGNPGEPEGAAGSVYLTMPVILYGDLKDGQPYRRSADVVLRRVNDVPGSTEAQRRWHIERIDWAA